MLKKTLYIIILVLTCVFITACSNNETSTTKTPTRTGSGTTNTNTYISYISNIPVVNKKDIIFASPNGSSNADGTIKRPYSLTNALNVMKAGETIYLLSGTYQINDGINLAKAGSEESRNSIIGVANDIVFDFNGNGLVIEGSYWYIYNIKFANANNDGCLVKGNGNILDQCVSYDNIGNGFVCGLSSLSASDNQFIGCVAMNNRGSTTSCGFKFEGNGLNNALNSCVAYRNEETGFYIFGDKNILLVNCIAIQNGDDADQISGYGYKFSDSAHVFENCTALDNKKAGFFVQCTGGSFTVKNCSSINNGINYNASSSGTTTMNYVNCLSYNKNNQLNDVIIGKAQNCLFSIGNKYYYTGVAQKNINTVENAAYVGTELTTTQAEKYIISIELPNDFDPCTLVTIDGIIIDEDILGAGFFDRNERFQDLVIPNTIKEYFGSKYKTAS